MLDVKQMILGSKWMVIYLCAALCLGAWWDFGKSTKEDESTKKRQRNSQAQPIFEVIPDQPANTVDADSKKRIEEPRFAVATTSRSGEAEETSSETAVETEEKAPEAESSESSEKQREQMENVQAELKEIIDRTHQLQAQVKDNRSEIQKILERAQIHERILKNINIPKSTPMKSQISAEDIVRQEKLRLIAEQARQTQQQLRVIQQTRSLGRSTPSAPTETKTSNTS